MKVEIWSDVACPWCYVGKRHFEEALSRFSHADQVEVTWRSFELDPHAPTSVGMSMDRMLERKYGMTAEQARAANRRMTELAAATGLEYHLDAIKAGSSFDAHRVIHLASAQGMGDRMKERLLAAYFTEGRSVGDHNELSALAVEVGLDGEEVRALLSGDRLGDAVRADEANASAYGVSGVPFFLLDEAYGVAGAQSPEVLLDALEQAWAASHPRPTSGPGVIATAGGQSAG